MMDALTRAREYLDTCDEQYGADRGNWRPADLCLAALVAEIEGSPVVDVFKYRGSITIEPDDESLVGKRVRLLALDSGGAGEVANNFNRNEEKGDG